MRYLTRFNFFLSMIVFFATFFSLTENMDTDIPSPSAVWVGFIASCLLLLQSIVALLDEPTKQ